MSNPASQSKPNPNGANQSNPDPRQLLFIKYYFDPEEKETFSNAYQSAIKAGYAEEYAQNITSIMPKWLSETIGDQRIVQQAEKNLLEMLEMDTLTDVVKGKGENVIKITVDDPQMKRIKADMTKFALERLRKDKYSSRQEVTGKDGGDLFEQMIDSYQTTVTVLKAAQAVLEDDKKE